MQFITLCHRLETMCHSESSNLIRKNNQNQLVSEYTAQIELKFDGILCVRVNQEEVL